MLEFVAQAAGDDLQAPVDLVRRGGQGRHEPQHLKDGRAGLGGKEEGRERGGKDESES